MPAGTRVTARERLGPATVRLAAAGVATPRVDAEWLLADALGVRRGDLWLALDRELDGDADERFEQALARRERREPLQHVLGWEEFRGIRLRVTPDVLVPRPETEMLVELALELLPAPGGRPRLVFDVGTGSGCIACAIARERPDTRVLATDRSMAALLVARTNVRALGLASRVAVAAADLLTAVRPGRVDLIVGNPPYLPSATVPALMPEVGRHEPRLALDGGTDGTACLRQLVDGARRVLRPGGALALETAGAEQARQVATLLAGIGFLEVVVRADLAGVRRLVAGRAPAAAGQER